MPVVVLLVVLAFLVYHQRTRGFGPVTRQIGIVLAWFVVGLCVLLGAGLVVAGIANASPLGRAAMLAVGVASVLAWFARRRVLQRSPERVRRIDRIAFVGAFGVYLAAAVVWLVLGLLPALAAAFPAVEDQLTEWGTTYDNTFGDFAQRAADASLNSSSGVQVTLDYAFSILNLALATFLVVKVRDNRTANLLAVGMVGTAVAFNLQSHAALIVIGDSFGGITES
jgi:hypothetical protein